VFEIEPILWLQSWASPGLTAAMNAVSLLGYTRAYIAMAAVLAFAFRQRAAVALLVLLGLNGAVTDIAKTLAEAPRPDWERGQVEALSMWAPEMSAPEETPLPREDDYGFPSGHVSTTTAFVVGLAILLRWRGARSTDPADHVGVGLHDCLERHGAAAARHRHIEPQLGAAGGGGAAQRRAAHRPGPAHAVQARQRWTALTSASG